VESSELQFERADWVLFRSTDTTRYVLEREDGGYWTKWPQENRVELNSMSSPASIARLDLKLLERNGQKVIPPAEVASGEIAGRIEKRVRADLTEDIIRRAHLEEKVATRISVSDPLPASELVGRIERALHEEPESIWRDHLDALAQEILRRRTP
jgi:hypothetical protein